MNKTIFFSILFFIVEIFSSCTTNDIHQTSCYSNSDTPTWAIENGTVFKSSDRNKFYPDAIDTGTKGFYSTASANYGDINQSASAARLNAKVLLSIYITELLNVYILDHNKHSNNELQVLNSEKINIYLTKSLVLDSYKRNDETIYSLIFISLSDLEKSFSKTEYKSIFKQIIKNF